MFAHTPVAFRSAGHILAGFLYGVDPANTGIVVASGYLGLKEWVPARVIPILLRAGYACLSFDYRGSGASEGPRGRLIPTEEADDLRSAVDFMASRVGRVAVAGWGLGAAVAIHAAAADPRVAAVICLNGVGDVARSIGQDAEALVAGVRANSREGRIDWERVVWPSRAGADAALVERDVATLGAATTTFQRTIPVESAEAYYRFRADDLAERISPRPILFLHGSVNTLYPVSEAHALWTRARQPKELIEVAGAGHLDLLDDAEQNLAPAVNWLAQHVPA